MVGIIRQTNKQKIIEEGDFNAQCKRYSRNNHK